MAFVFFYKFLYLYMQKHRPMHNCNSPNNSKQVMKRIHVHHPCIYEKIKHVLNAFEFNFKLKRYFLCACEKNLDFIIASI